MIHSYLEPLSGDLFTRRTLAQASYTFTVVARDLTGSTSSASTGVTVSVSGMKNNPPSFANNPPIAVQFLLICL